MKFLLKPFALVAALFAVTPAFASDHTAINWSDGPIMAIINYVVWEITHFWGHLQALTLAASTGNWELFLDANICASEGVLTSVLFTKSGWQMIFLIALGAVVLRLLWKSRMEIAENFRMSIASQRQARIPIGQR